MAVEYRVPEPFPVFVDSKGPSSSSYYYSSRMSLLSLFGSESPASRFRAWISVPETINNYLWLKYHQYELTYGLYMMDPWEVAVINTIVFTIFALLMCGVVFGIQPLLVRTVCRMFFCISGSYDGVEDICT